MKKTAVIFVTGFLLGGIFLNNVLLNKITSTPVAILPDGGDYFGDMADGVLHGFGEIQWPDGMRYKGEFNNGLFHGEGRMVYSTGESYEGIFTKGEITGIGEFIFSELSHYRGEMQNGLMHGSGTFVDKNGEYTGQFKDNFFHGIGSYQQASGDRYSGMFKEGLYHGKGIYIGNDDEQYNGEFVKGIFTGQGLHKPEDGSEYQGGFDNWLYQGQGTFTDSEGNKWIGQYENGVLTGQGELIGKDGYLYRGEFSDWRYDGEGEFHSAQGDIYKGSFKYGKYHGQGTMVYKKPLDGIKTINGTWHRGGLVSDEARPELLSQKSFHELALYNQNELLEKAWQNIEENNPNKIDLYLLSVAGDGRQGVFRREANSIKQYFDDALGTQGKSMQLVNSRLTARDIPQSTVTSIKASLNSMAQRMDAQQDILFVYLTSHGSIDHKFYLNHPEMPLNDLSAQELANMLAEIPVKHKVVVISACYSGGFIDALKNDNTLIMTAAAFDRTSFGCADNNEFTYFGEALVKDALPNSKSFSEAFDQAFEIVSQREKDQGFEPSMPQIHKPNGILAQLKKWRAGLPKKDAEGIKDVNN
jgi:hypothetical protein